MKNSIAKYTYLYLKFSYLHYVVLINFFSLIFEKKKDYPLLLQKPVLIYVIQISYRLQSFF